MKNITVFCLCFFFLNQSSSQDIFSEYENEDSSNTSDNQKLNEKDNIVFEDLTNNNTDLMSFSPLETTKPPKQDLMSLPPLETTKPPEQTNKTSDLVFLQPSKLQLQQPNQADQTFHKAFHFFHSENEKTRHELKGFLGSIVPCTYVQDEFVNEGDFSQFPKLPTLIEKSVNEKITEFIVSIHGIVILVLFGIICCLIVIVAGLTCCLLKNNQAATIPNIELGNLEPEQVVDQEPVENEII